MSAPANALLTHYSVFCFCYDVVARGEHLNTCVHVSCCYKSRAKISPALLLLYISWSYTHNFGYNSINRRPRPILARTSGIRSWHKNSRGLCLLAYREAASAVLITPCSPTSFVRKRAASAQGNTPKRDTTLPPGHNEKNKTVGWEFRTT